MGLNGAQFMKSILCFIILFSIIVYVLSLFISLTEIKDILQTKFDRLK